MTYFGAVPRTALFSDKRKQALLFTSRAYSQLIGRHQKDDGRASIAIKKLWLLNGNGARRTFNTTRYTSNKNQDDPCGEKQPTNCRIPVEILPCDQIKIPTWKGAPCLKVCLPCCKPIRTPVRCDRLILRLNLCSGVEYKYPSYSQTVETVGCGLNRPDCCYPPLCKDIYPIGYVKKLLPIKELQKQKLGLPPGNRRFYSTSARLNGKQQCPPKADTEGRPGQPIRLPCLKSAPSSAVKGKKKTSGGIKCKYCLKVCTPCCPSARDPPTCAFPYVKPPCARKPAPGPAYSECHSEKEPSSAPCECQYTVLKRCSTK